VGELVVVGRHTACRRRRPAWWIVSKRRKSKNDHMSYQVKGGHTADVVTPRRIYWPRSVSFQSNLTPSSALPRSGVERAWCRFASNRTLLTESVSLCEADAEVM